MAFRELPVRPPARPLRVLDPRRGLPDPRARRQGGPARDAGGVAHRPRLAGRRDRPLQGRQQAGREADHRLRGVRHRRPARADEGDGAPHPAGRDDGRLRQPDQALLARLPGGLLLPAARRLGAPLAVRAGPDRALRLPVGAGLEGDLGGPDGRRRDGARPAGADLRPRQHLRRAPERGARDPAVGVQLAARARREARPAARRDGRRALPRRHRRLPARGAPLHPVGRLAEEPEPLEVRRQRVLLQDARGDGARLPRARGRDAAHARDRRPLQRRDPARPDPAAAVPDAGRPRRLRLPRRAVREGPREALRPRHLRADRAPPVRAQDGARDGLPRLLPDRRRLHRVREGQRRLGRAGPRQRRRLARRLLPRDHRRRPDAVRAHVRALPQPGPQGHARHGHRLRRRGSRARDQLRGREVRARSRGADHHLLDDGRPRRRARCRAGARDPVRHRRPDREDDPGRPRPDARGGA